MDSLFGTTLEMDEAGPGAERLGLEVWGWRSGDGEGGMGLGGEGGGARGGDSGQRREGTVAGKLHPPHGEIGTTYRADRRQRRSR